MEPSLTRDLGTVLSSLNQTLQQMRFSIEDMRRQPVVGGFASSFAPINAQQAQFLNTLAPTNLYAPERFAIQPRVTLTDLLYTAWRGGVPIYRPYVTPTEQLQAQGIYANLMGSNAFGLAGQVIGGTVAFFNPLLGFGISAATAAIQGLYSNYIMRFPEVERTRQVLSPHFSEMTRTGYKGMTFSDAQRAMNAIIDLSLESAAFGVGELRDLTARIARTNLLSGVRTVEDFKRRMKELMNSVREITGALHISYEDAVNMLSQLARYGISPDKVSQFSYLMRNVAAGMGVNAGAYTASTLQNVNTYNQMGVTAAGAVNLSILPGLVLSTVRTYLPDELYKALGISGRQEEVLSGLQQGMNRALTVPSFQMALLGAAQAGMNTWSTSYERLISLGAQQVSKNPLLANPYARMAEIGRIVQESPELFMGAMKQYVRMYEQLYMRMGASQQQARRTAIQNLLGISQPEIAETIGNIFETIEPWQIPVALSSFNEMAERERAMDKALYQRQDYVAQSVKRFISRINIFSPNWVGWRALNQRIWNRLSWANLGVGTDYLSAFMAGLIGTVDTFLPASASFTNRYFGPTAWQQELTANQLGKISQIYGLGVTGQDYAEQLRRAKVLEDGRINASVANFIGLLTSGSAAKQLATQLGLTDQKALLQIGVGEYTALGLDQKVLKEEVESISRQLEKGLVVKITDEIKINSAQWQKLTDEQRQVIAALRYAITSPDFRAVGGTVASKLTTLERKLTEEGIPQPIASMLLYRVSTQKPEIIQKMDFSKPETINEALKEVGQLFEGMKSKQAEYAKFSYEELTNTLDRMKISSNARMRQALGLLTGPTPDFTTFMQVAKQEKYNEEQIYDIMLLSVANPNFARYVAEKNNWTVLSTGQVIPYKLSIPDARYVRDIPGYLRQELERRYSTLGKSFGELTEKQKEELEKISGRLLSSSVPTADYYSEKIQTALKRELPAARLGLIYQRDASAYADYRKLEDLANIPKEILPIAFLAALTFEGKKKVSLEEFFDFARKYQENPAEVEKTLKKYSEQDIQGKISNVAFRNRMVEFAYLMELPVLDLAYRGIQSSTPTVKRQEAAEKLMKFAGRTYSAFQPIPEPFERLSEMVELASQYSDVSIQRNIIKSALDEKTLKQFGGKSRQEVEDYIINKMLAPTTSSWDKLTGQLQDTSKVQKELTDATVELTQEIRELNRKLSSLSSGQTNNPRTLGENPILKLFISPKA